MVLTKSERLERERAIIEQLKQDKPVTEIAHRLHVSFTDISHIKKKYEEEQEKIQSQSKVVQSYVREQHKDQKCGLDTETITQVNQDTQRDYIYETLTSTNKRLTEEKRGLNNIIFSQREEIQVLKDELKHARIKNRSGIIIMKTESLYADVRFLLNRDAEYCYLIYEDNKLKRLVDALQYEDDLTKDIGREERAKEEPIHERNNKFKVLDDGSIC